MHRRLSVALFVLSLGLNDAFAQETINNASLAGRVTDSTGAVIRNASVTATATATGISTTAVTDSAGFFRFPYLQVGQYQVTFHDAGFADAKRTLTLTIGAAFDLPVTLTVGSSDSVTVQDAAPVLEADRSQIAGTISQGEVADLPYNGRNFLDLALLVPGVSPTNTAANQLFAETSAVPGQGISVSSQHNFSNSFLVDGLSANDDAAGLVQAAFGLDVVQEMQVVTSGGQAEFGRALGGYINFVSKSWCFFLLVCSVPRARRRQHGQRDVPVPSLPAADLVAIEAALSLGGHRSYDGRQFVRYTRSAPVDS